MTNLAARLQAAAGAGEVLLSEEAERRTSDWLEERNLPTEAATLTLNGFVEPVRVLRLHTVARSAAS